MIEGMSDIEDLDPEKVKDKLWRENNSLISSYFNYGFNEQTWKSYLKEALRFYGKNKTNTFVAKGIKTSEMIDYYNKHN